MREILFRGKIRETGSWVEGFFCGQTCKSFFGVPVHRTQIIVKDDLGWAEVIPETLGQFTGLTDKNGKKVFEGDIVKTADVTYNGEVQIPGGRYHIAFRKGCWLIINENEEWDFLCTNEDCEVIGNIHDNPELLEVPNETR